MNTIEIKQDSQVDHKFESYPSSVRPKLEHLRNLIVETASENESTDKLEVTLKWGEPTFKVKKGSPVRIDWKPKAPDQYAMYFICTTSLVETFRMVYGDTFKYEKNRALIFNLEEPIPEKELKDCINMALNYQSLKEKPFLGR